MMKPVLFMISFLISFYAFAKPVSEIRFMGKVSSFDQKWITVDVDDKKFRVPRESIKGDFKAGERREVALTPKQYREMKLHFVTEKSK